MFLFVTLITVLDFLIPGWLTDSVGGGRKAVIGSTVGLIAGLFYAPFGLLIGPFIGALVGEFIDSHKWVQSIKVAAYSLLSLVIGTVFKFITCIIILIMCVGNAVYHYICN